MLYNRKVRFSVFVKIASHYREKQKIILAIIELQNTYLLYIIEQGPLLGREST